MHLRAPEQIEEPLRHILAVTELAPSAPPGPLKDQSRLVLVRRLVREGFATLVGDAGSGE